jgi:hypothetical protein
MSINLNRHGNARPTEITETCNFSTKLKARRLNRIPGYDVYIHDSLSSLPCLSQDVFHGGN